MAESVTDIVAVVPVVVLEAAGAAIVAGVAAARLDGSCIS